MKHTTRKGKFGIEIYVLDKNQGGYTAFFKDFPNIVTQGETIKDAQGHLWTTIYDILLFKMQNR